MGVEQTKRPIAEIPTIDCSLVTIETEDGTEFGFDTSNKVAVEPQIETTEAVKLIIKNILRAQKPEESVITGNKVTLTDNVFNPELVLLLQGGTITYDAVDPTIVVGYKPPVVGSSDKGESFKLNCYSAQYDETGSIVKYEKISYPNCKGTPVAFSSEDGVFRAPEYVINSTPANGQAPFELTYVNALPSLVDDYALATLTVTSIAGTTVGATKISVLPIKESYTNVYYYKVDASQIALPEYGDTLTGYILWDGVADITATTAQNIAVIECTSDGKALAGGQTTVVAKS